jgi:DNA-directed RNA polymerase subunit beta'
MVNQADSTSGIHNELSFQTTGKLFHEELQGQSSMQTGFKKKYLSLRAKKLISTLLVYGKDGELICSYELTCWLHLMAGNW